MKTKLDLDTFDNMCNKDIDRSTFLKIVATAGFATMIPNGEALAYSSNAKAKVVIVGGGAAGLSMAARLTNWLSQPNITLIDPSDRQFYQPGYTMIAGGIFTANEVHRPQEEFIPKGVKWIKDVATAVDPDKKSVTTGSGEVIEYDFLVLTPGLQVNFDQVEGISLDRLGEGNAHSIYDFNGAQRCWDAMDKFTTEGGKGVYSDTYTKSKCGGAPKKILLLSEHLSRKKDNRQAMDFQYYTAAKELYDVPYYTPRLLEIYNERGLPIHYSYRLTGIDTSAKRAYFDQVKEIKSEIVDQDGNKTVVKELQRSPISTDYDFMHFVPPMSAPDFVRDSGLGISGEGSWIEVDPKTMIHKRYNNIVSLGDCSNLPTSKTSAAIRMQVPIAAKNLIQLMEGGNNFEEYDGYAACPIITEYGKVLMCEFDYNKDPKPTLPLIDASKEQWASWILKKYMLKPIYFYGMLNGWM